MVGLGIFLLIIMAGQEDQKELNVTRQSSPTDSILSVTEDNGILQLSTATHRDFIFAIGKYRNQYDAASNDLQRSEVRHKRREALSDILKKRPVENWVGQIKELTTTRDGKAILELYLGSSVWIGTWNNSLSDINDYTLISPDSALYRQLSSMQPGILVRFSGVFFPSEMDHVKEVSLTERGSLMEPKFLVKFISVEAIN